MDDKIFDLTVPVTRQNRVFFRIMGFLQVANGVLTIDRGDQMRGLGLSMMALGLIVLTSNSIMQRANKYILVFNEEHLDIGRGFFKHRIIPWKGIAKIHVRLMSVDLLLAEGGERQIAFGELDYRVNQEIKPLIIAALKEFAEAKKVPLTEG